MNADVHFGYILAKNYGRGPLITAIKQKHLRGSCCPSLGLQAHRSIRSASQCDLAVPFERTCTTKRRADVVEM